MTFSCIFGGKSRLRFSSCVLSASSLRFIFDKSSFRVSVLFFSAWTCNKVSPNKIPIGKILLYSPEKIQKKRINIDFHNIIVEFTIIIMRPSSWYQECIIALVSVSSVVIIWSYGEGDCCINFSAFKSPMGNYRYRDFML